MVLLIIILGAFQVPPSMSLYKTTTKNKKTKEK